MRKELQDLRRAMERSGADAYLITGDDFHGSEYVGEHFQCRAFVSGFTGSAGTLIVLQDRAGLWTDGRYFLQAEEQLAGSGITLYKSGEKGVLTESAFLTNYLRDGQTLAFDGRTVMARRIHTLNRALLGIRLLPHGDLVGSIWNDRPPLSHAKAWQLDLDYCGVPRAEKLSRVRNEMEKKNVDVLLITAPESIAWLLNLRGGDVAYCPLLLSYLFLNRDSARLYAAEDAISPDLRAALAADGIDLSPYGAVYEDAKTIQRGSRIWADEERTNFALWDILQERGEVYAAPDPTLLPKAIKNDVESNNLRVAHLRDGAAIVRFIRWVKEAVRHEELTELDASRRLEAWRAEQTHYLGPSFAPIMAYGAHGAIVHYEATRESNAVLRGEGFLLFDTGGHYLEGTTDVTRTIALGAVSARAKAQYTAVLRAHLALLNARFPHGCRGSALDALAREPLWEQGLDYNHGTGHGVGYLLNVHEGPNALRWRSAGKDAVLEPNMVLSNEPGLYLAGEYGIRLENLMLCRDWQETEHGRFLCFEALTMVPFDRDAIEVSLLSPRERQWLDAYHAAVYEHLRPLLTAEETAWLARATAPI